jgi:hypothetical protein
MGSTVKKLLDVGDAVRGKFRSNRSEAEQDGK